MKILQFSGGLDSLACLLLMQTVPDLTVVTVHTDGMHDGTVEYLARVQAAFPQVKFAIFQTERDLPQYGQPVDVIPLRWTGLGQLVLGGKDVRYQDTFSCCNRGIWEPLDRISRGLGATEIYRGQRTDDRQRSPLNDGDVDRGVTMYFPVGDWSRGKVVAYVKAHAPDLMPPGYAEGEKTSRDCWDCTAYLSDNRQRIANLPPAQKLHVNTLLTRWTDDVLTEMEARP